MGKLFRIEVLEVRPTVIDADAFCDSCGKQTQDLFKTCVSVKDITSIKFLCSTCLGAHAGLTLLSEPEVEKQVGQRSKPNFKGGK